MYLLGPQTESSHLVEDLVCRFHPCERLAFVIVRGHVGEDGVAQSGHAGVRTATQRFLGEHAEKPFDEIEPGRAGR